MEENKNGLVFSEKSLHLFAGAGGVSLEIYCSDEKLLGQLKSRHTQEKFCSQDRQIKYCPISQSGMMSLLSDWIIMKQKNTSNISNQSEKNSVFVEDSLAKTCQLQANKQGLMENVQDFGLKCSESLAKYDQSISLWRTHQCSLFEDLIESQETFPKSGMTVNGQLWELMMLTPHTKEKDYGLPDVENDNWGGGK